MSNEQHVALYFKEGKSDKEYHVHLLQASGGFRVTIEYGRRGNSLTASEKFDKPVDLDKARATFDELVHSKKLKGYTEAAGVQPYVGTDKEERITNILPQLLNNIEEDKLDAYFDDPAFCMQEKKDGKRILLRRQDGGVEAINRKGLLVGFPQSIVDRINQGTEERVFLADGELIGEVIWLFDLLELGHTDLRSKGYSERYKTLVESFVSLDTKESSIQLVPIAFTAAKKRKVFEEVKGRRGEGVVFKRVTAPYTAGRPNSGGNQLKFKFKGTCTAQVSAHNEKGKRSVYLQMLDGKELIDVGKITVLPNFPMPKIGTLIEAEYLYRHVHGALYQPVYLGERDDLDVPDQVKTLKVKEGIDEEDS